MAEHLKLDQYDDDLTVGLDDFDDDLYVDEEDLLRYQAPESPLTNLKSLVVSIDWEITDEVLLQFNEEILRLRDEWADEKIYLVYLQALEQVSKYIYQEKSQVHPNAVKLLPLFFQNLDTVASSELMDEEEKQKILVADVQRFNQLKKDIAVRNKRKMAKASGDGGGTLQKLKALVLGLDWEVKEEDLGALREEVSSLEDLYRASKTRLILLQGIGTLAAYIQHKGGNAHASAFSVLHDFFASLEKLASESFSPVEEKELVLVEVEKFNAFKARIAQTLSPEALQRDQDERDEEESSQEETTGSVLPAFADVSPEKAHGFQEDVVAEGIVDKEDISDRLGDFFPDEPVKESVADEEDALTGETQDRLDDFFGDAFEEGVPETEASIALQGVDVESEADDDTDEEELARFGDELAPALQDNTSIEDEVVQPQELDVVDEAESRLDDFFDTSIAEDVEPDPSQILQGVQVESEADDDSDEEDLARVDGKLAPALSAEAIGDDFDSPVAGATDVVAGSIHVEEESMAAFSSDDLGETDTEAEIESSFSFFDEEEAEEPVSSIDDFFDDEQAAEPVASPVAAQNDEILDESSIESTLDSFFGADEFDAAPEESGITQSQAAEDSPAHALAGAVTEGEEDIDSFFAEDSPTPALAASSDEVIEEKQRDEESVALEEGLEDTLDAFFGSEPDSSLENAHEDIDGVDDFFGDDSVVAALSGDEDVALTEDLDASLPLEAPIAAVAAVAGIGGALAASSADTESKQGDLEEGEEDLLFFEEVAEEDLEDEVVDELPVVAEITDSVEKESYLFENIRGSISSLGFDISEQIVQGILGDIDDLQQKFNEDPIVKSYLQLMSTLSDHVLKYQYEASSEAFTLLGDVLNSLEESIEKEPIELQNALYGETFKVLQWQQNLIDEKGMGNNSYPKVSESPVVESEEDELFAEGEDELIYAVLEEENGLKESKDVEVLRGELQELRETLQEEISRLRTDLLQK